MGSPLGPARLHRAVTGSNAKIRIGFFLPYSAVTSALVWLGKLGGAIRVLSESQ
jgi:hypothetical protein